MIAESDAILKEHEGSSDSVAIRAVDQALFAKARALTRLRRFEECVVLCDESLDRPDQSDLTRLKTLAIKSAGLMALHADCDAVRTVDEAWELFDDLGQPDRLVLLVAGILVLKVSALGRLGRVEEAIRADEELIDRFGERPTASLQVIRALCDKASHLLKVPERVDEAIAISESITQRVQSEPDATLVAVAPVVLDHLRLLAAFGSSTVGGIALMAGVVFGSVTIAVVQSGHEFLLRHAPGKAAALSPPIRLEAAASLIGPLDRSRRRLAQCLVLSRELIERIGVTEDPELRRFSAVARTIEASSLIGLGDIGEGTRAFAALTGDIDSGAAQGFQLLASAVDASTRLGKVSKLIFLRMRAEALGLGGDAVAQVAFDDSVGTADPDIQSSRSMRWMARVLRFRGKGDIVVPDHPPEQNG